MDTDATTTAPCVTLPSAVSALTSGAPLPRSPAIAAKGGDRKKVKK
jgi:hypothetical protein